MRTLIAIACLVLGAVAGVVGERWTSVSSFWFGRTGGPVITALVENWDGTGSACLEWDSLAVAAEVECLSYPRTWVRP